MVNAGTDDIDLRRLYLGAKNDGRRDFASIVRARIREGTRWIAGVDGLLGVVLSPCYTDGILFSTGIIAPTLLRGNNGFWG